MSEPNVLSIRVMGDVVDERVRQEELKAQGRFPWTCADVGPGDGAKLAILVEETGEVARAMNDREGRARLRAELIQVAACAIAWCEAIDRELDRGAVR